MDVGTEPAFQDLDVGLDANSETLDVELWGSMPPGRSDSGREEVRKPLAEANDAEPECLHAQLVRE